MKFLNSLKILMAIGLTFNIAACQPIPLTQKEQKTVKNLTTNLKTHCVGRYLVDLPQDAGVAWHSVTLQGVTIESKSMSLVEFLREMEQREIELKRMKHSEGVQFLYSEREYPFLLTSTAELRKKHIWSFVHVGSIYDDPGNRIIEVYKWNNDVRIKLMIEGSDFTRPDQTDDSIVQQMTEKERNDVPQKLSEVFNLAHKFRGRAAGEIPTEPGVCFDGGFIRGEAEDGESFDTQFVMPNYPNDDFTFTTDTRMHEDETLLQRSNGLAVVATLVTSGVKTLRKGPVALKNLSAEEWLLATQTSYHVPGLAFRMEANTLSKSVREPVVILEMHTVRPNAYEKTLRTDQPSLTEGEAIALWDIVSRTVRPRPNGF